MNCKDKEIFQILNLHDILNLSKHQLHKEKVLSSGWTTTINITE